MKISGVSFLFLMRKRHVALCFMACFVMLALNSVAQNISKEKDPKDLVKVRGGFIEDSLKIGEPGRFYLTATYPKELDVIFPDSSFTYAPFEFEGKRYYPTETSDGVSYDSVIYDLSTFEIGRTQYMNLPVFQLNPQDCTVYRSPADSILLTQLVTFSLDTIPSDALPLKVTVAYYPIPTRFNYPVLITVITFMLVLAALVWVGFGKKIRRHFRIKYMLKAHQQFLEGYSAQLNNLKGTFSPATTEGALAYWKKYMEQLEARPYTKLTTKETQNLERDEALAKNLQAIDKAIYGHNVGAVESLENLKGIAEKRFSLKLQEVKHG